ncbi:11209_t:CDS:2, partial [Gigaspora rosea]
TQCPRSTTASPASTSSSARKIPARKRKKTAKRNSKRPGKYPRVNYARKSTGDAHDNNIEYKRVLPRTQEEFDILKELGLSFSSGQYEYAPSSGLFHEQAYFQFNDCKTIKRIKEQVFGHRAMNFPKYLNGDSKHNLDYSTKTWNRSKDVDKCRCDFFTRDNLCDCCVKKNKKAEDRTLARWKKDELSKEIVGPFIFGKYLTLSSTINEDDNNDKINEIKLEDLNKIKEIQKASSYEEAMNRPLTEFPTTCFSTGQGIKFMFDENKRLNSKIKEFAKKNFHPKNFLFFSDSGSGKTTIAEKLAEELAKGREICYKSNDSKYIDYTNQEVLVKQELVHNTWLLEELLNLCEKDICPMNRK